MLDLPPRPKEIVPIVVDGPLSAVERSWQLRPPQDTLVVIVRGTCALVPGGGAELTISPQLPTGDLFYGDAAAGSLRHASDLAPFKPQADVTLVGHAYRRSSRSGVALVQLAVGSLRRAVAAIGDRTWQGEVPSEPRPWTRLPLQWERAFGGPGHEPNPVGRGMDGQLLPNLEDSDALIVSPRDRPAPVCFAPLAHTWPARSSKLGTYDQVWQRDRWPYFPADFDWSYFNAAPVAQQIPYLRGDESFDLAGVHAEHAVLSGRLPGLTARIFAQYSSEAGGAFREVVANLDTVSFDADELTVSLVWRGILDVSQESAPEIDRLFVCADRLDAPMDAVAAQHRFLAKLVELHGPQVVCEELTAMDSVGAKGGAAGATPASAAQQSAPLVAPVLTRESALMLLEQGSSLAGLCFAGCDLTGVDFGGRSLTNALFTDAQLDGARFDAAQLEGAVFVRARAREASFKGADLTAANLSEAILAAADFSEATLPGASLTEADLAGACFDGANLLAAKLTDSRLVGASFEGAEAKGADLSGSELGGASFRRATLDDAQLYDCVAEGVHFDEASLLGMRADGAKLAGGHFARVKAAEASFESADLDGADFSEADLSRAVFSHAKLCRATLSSATAVGARFRHASLAGARAFKANLMQANFESADLSGADLRSANLYAAETWKAALHGTRLDQALTAASKLAT